MKTFSLSTFSSLQSIALVSLFLLGGGVFDAAALPSPEHPQYHRGSLFWDAVPGAVYYVIGQSSRPLGPFRLLSNHHLLTNAATADLVVSTHYYFVVYAADKQGNVSAASIPVDVFLKPPPKPDMRRGAVFAVNFRAARKNACKQR